MNILHIIASLNPQKGGPSAGLIALTNAVRDAGHKVEIACLDAPDAPWIRNLDFIPYTLGPTFLSYGYTSKLKPWLQNNLRRFDAVIVEGLWQYHGYATRKVANKVGVPYYVMSHGMLSPWFKANYPLKHIKKWLYWPWGEYRILRDAAAVLFTAEEEMTLARQSFWLYHCKESVIGYGIQRIEMMNPQSKVDTFFEHYPHLKEKPFILFLGRLHQVKGCDLIIQSLPLLRENCRDIHVVFAGPDWNANQLQLEELASSLKVSKQISFIGMVSGDLKWGSILAAEALILPSHQENFGVVIPEALSCGRPVLISDKVNIWREIRRGDAGIVESDTIEGVTKLLSSWAETPQTQRDLMGERAVKCFQDNFQIANVAQRLIQLIQQR